MAVLDRVAGGLARSAGSSGQRTFQGFMSGGKAAAEKLFNGLTRGSSEARGGGRLGGLADGSKVQMSTRTLSNGSVQTDVRISRTYTPTGSLIQKTEHIKIRFQEK
jgi:hypothetical protein